MKTTSVSAACLALNLVLSAKCNYYLDYEITPNMTSSYPKFMEMRASMLRKPPKVDLSSVSWQHFRYAGLYIKDAQYGMLNISYDLTDLYKQHETIAHNLRSSNLSTLLASDTLALALLHGTINAFNETGVVLGTLSETIQIEFTRAEEEWRSMSEADRQKRFPPLLAVIPWIIAAVGTTAGVTGTAIGIDYLMNKNKEIGVVKERLNHVEDKTTVLADQIVEGIEDQHSLNTGILSLINDTSAQQQKQAAIQEQTKQYLLLKEQVNEEKLQVQEFQRMLVSASNGIFPWQSFPSLDPTDVVKMNLRTYISVNRGLRLFATTRTDLMKCRTSISYTSTGFAMAIYVPFSNVTKEMNVWRFLGGPLEIRGNFSVTSNRLKGHYYVENSKLHALMSPSEFIECRRELRDLLECPLFTTFRIKKPFSVTKDTPKDELLCLRSIKYKRPLGIRTYCELELTRTVDTVYDSGDGVYQIYTDDQFMEGTTYCQKKDRLEVKPWRVRSGTVLTVPRGCRANTSLYDFGPVSYPTTIDVFPFRNLVKPIDWKNSVTNHLDLETIEKLTNETDSVLFKAKTFDLKMAEHAVIESKLRIKQELLNDLTYFGTIAALALVGVASLVAACCWFSYKTSTKSDTAQQAGFVLPPMYQSRTNLPMLDWEEDYY